MHTDRYILALALLEGDRAARQVLADMLEEQGDRGLAQWAREGRNDKRRTVEFVVMLLSCRPAVGLAAAFIAKGCFRVGPAGKQMVMAAQDWAGNRLASRAAIESCRREGAGWLHEHRNSRFPDEPWERNQKAACVDLLIGAIQRASEAEQFAARGDSARAARDLESRQYVRQIVCQTRGGWHQSDLTWQTTQLQQLLKQLVESKEDLWPR